MKRLLPLNAKFWEGNSIIINVKSDGIAIDDKTKQLLADNPPE